MKQFIKITLAVTFLFSYLEGYTQEYDDLYFNKSDREKQKTSWVRETYSLPQDNANTGILRSAEIDENFKPTSFLGKQYDREPLLEDFSGSARLKPVDDYKPKKTIEYYTSSNFSTPSNSSISNTPQTAFQNENNSNPIDSYQNEPVVINNYYGDAGWNNWNRPRWNLGFGWNNWGGNFWNVSYGQSSWYDPFWNPWFYDPFYGSAWGWNVGFGWNNWGRSRNAWCRPRWGGYGRPIYVVNNTRDTRYRRKIVRGARNVRGGPVSSSGRSTNTTRSLSSNIGGKSSRYSRLQSRYYDRSRNSRSSSMNARSATNTNARRSISDPNARIRQGGSSSNSSKNSAYRSNRSSRHSGTIRPRSPRSSAGRSTSVRSGSSRSSSRQSGSIRSGSSRSSSRQSGSVRSGSSRSRPPSRSSGRSGSRGRN